MNFIKKALLEQNKFAPKINWFNKFRHWQRFEIQHEMEKGKEMGTLNHVDRAFPAAADRVHGYNKEKFLLTGRYRNIADINGVEKEKKDRKVAAWQELFMQ